MRTPQSFSIFPSSFKVGAARLGHRYWSALFATVILLSGCGSDAGVGEVSDEEMIQAEQASDAVVDAVDEAGARAFQACVACHTLGADEPHRLGPNLFGIVGRAAASQEGFNYSSALQQSGLTWDRQTLVRWIKQPMSTVPGSRMVYMNRLSDSEIDQLLNYLDAGSAEAGQ